MTNTERLYKIERMIHGRGHVGFQALLDELEVSRATLKRDLEFLRDRLGAPIVYDRFLNGYKFAQPVRGQGKHELPGLWFNERELYSLLMAHHLLSDLDSGGLLSRHLQPLLDRIHQLLGDSQADARALMKRVKIVTSARRPVPGKHFETVGEAVTKRRRLQMTYLTRSRGVVSQREVSPQRLVHYRNTWYLDAWCHREDELRRFALDAIEQASVLDTRAKDVAMKAVEAAMDTGYGIYAGKKRQWATLVFQPHAAQWVSKEEWHPEQQARWLEDGRYEVRLPYTDETEVVMDVLRHGDQVCVTSPAALSRAIKARLAAGSAQYD